MKPRNDALHAEVERIVALKLQIPAYKNIAEKHHASVQTVRLLISERLRKLRKSTDVEIHVEQNSAKIEPCDG